MKKRLLLTTLSFLLLLGCVRYPAPGSLDGEYAVLTTYDDTVTFSKFTTYHIPDSVALISDDKSDPDRIKDIYAVEIINQIKINMNERGFQYTPDPALADLGITAAVLKNINVYSGYYPGYWWGYPGYYPPGYWGGYPGYYYPWNVTYVTQSGTMVIDMFDLMTADINQNIPVVWSAFLGDVYLVSNPISATKNGIDQAFEQSPYIDR